MKKNKRQANTKFRPTFINWNKNGATIKKFESTTDVARPDASNQH